MLICCADCTCVGPRVVRESVAAFGDFNGDAKLTLRFLDLKVFVSYCNSYCN